MDSFMLNNGSKEHRGGGVGLSVTAEQLKMGKPSGQINRDDEGIVNDNDFDDNTHGLFSMTTTRTRNSAVVGSNRRQMMTQGISSLVAVSAAICHPQSSSAAVGTLPELADTNAFLQGITVNVADGDQQKMMINFLVKSFDMEILRQTVQGSVEETWLGYGPEQLSIPDNFELPVSSFNKYGGHASINVRYDTQSIAPLYRQGDDPPGNNIAYLQLGVPGYRISQMIEYKGKIIDAYGLVNVVSPSGLPIRGIVGISPDPIMFVAINCRDVQESKVFYENLGFVEQDVPYSRPSKGTTMFEPAPPKGSCYMSPSGNTTTGMGILLLSGGKKNKSVIANPAVGSLNIVYNPSSSPSSSEITEEGKNLTLKDPSGDRKSVV